METLLGQTDVTVERIPSSSPFFPCHLTVPPRFLMNLGSFCLSLSSAKIPGEHQHAQLQECFHKHDELLGVSLLRQCCNQVPVYICSAPVRTKDFRNLFWTRLCDLQILTIMALKYSFCMLRFYNVVNIKCSVFLILRMLNYRYIDL